MPVFNSTDTVPHALDGHADLYNLSWEAMFWVNNYVANQAYNRYSQMIPDIRRVQGQLENELETAVAEASAAISGKPYAEAQAVLRNMTVDRTTDATVRYKQLGDYLFVKYLDGNIKKEEKRQICPYTDGMPVQPVFGGYNERYFRSIVEDAGDRLKVVEPQQ